MFLPTGESAIDVCYLYNQRKQKYLIRISTTFSIVDHRQNFDEAYARWIKRILVRTSKTARGMYSVVVYYCILL